MAKNYTLIQLRGDRTQGEVASAVRCDRSTYAHIENGTGVPSLKLARRIAEYYGVPIDTIFNSPDVVNQHRGTDQRAALGAYASSQATSTA